MLAVGLCEDHRRLNRFCWKLYRWIDCLFFVVFLNFIFTHFIEFKLKKKFLAFEKILFSKTELFFQIWLKTEINCQAVGVRYCLGSGKRSVSPICFISLKVYRNRASKMKFFAVKDIFILNFDFKNGCKNEFQHYNEKFCSWF